MAQPSQYQMPPQPQRQFSPPQSEPLATMQQQFSGPPTKRQRVSSPEPRQQSGNFYGSHQSPYSAVSPGSTNPTVPGVSPQFPNVNLPQGVYNTPYSNGRSTPPSLNHAHSNPPSQPSSLLAEFSRPSYVSARPDFSTYTIAPQGPTLGTMGPPSKPPEKAKEDADMTDVLGGTGIDLREEEQYTFQLSFNSSLSGSQAGTISSGHSFTQFPPGDAASFYGAGPANATAETANTKSQDEYAQKAANKAWADAAHNLAVSRQHELSNPFLDVAFVQAKMSKIARDHGVELNLDPKGTMGYMSRPDNFPQRDVRVNTAVGPDGIMVTTQGRFLPFDSMQVDQVALLSIATKHRLRSLVEDASKLAAGRQTGSQGIIPHDWKDVADVALDGSVPSGSDGAISSKRTTSENPTPVLLTPISDHSQLQFGQFTSLVVQSLRQSAKEERDLEEKRLQKKAERAARAAGVSIAPASSATSRQGSIVPGTPGSIAPEEKAPTKKEQKKKNEAKLNEAANHAAANVTTAKFLGGGMGLFGKKKTYSWMDKSSSGGSTPGGGGGSVLGASTPSRASTAGVPATPGTPVNESGPVKLTQDGVRRLGQHREDKDKGTGIQLRDWITVLEKDGRERFPLQRAYLNLDGSFPK